MSETQTATSGRDAARIRNAKRRRRLIVNSVVGGAIILALALLAISRRGKPRGPEGLVTGTVERADLVQAISATGSITAQTGAMVKIGSQITGRIKRLHADVGDLVRAGQVIAELDLPDLEAQVQQAEATLALNQRKLSEQLAGVELQRTQSRTDIERAQAGVGVAQTALRQAEDSAQLQIAAAEATLHQGEANAKNSSASLARTQQLYRNGYVAAADVDNAEAQAKANAALQANAQENLRLTRTKVSSDIASAKEQLTQARAAFAAAQAGTAQNVIKQHQVGEARAAVRQSDAALTVSRAQYDKAYIRSPIAGTVLQLAQQEGETIAAGLSAPTLIIVADLNRLQVDAYVDETDIGQVRLGQPVSVTVDAYPKRSFSGRVVKIASGATMQQNVVTYDVTVALDNPGHLLKPDMTATANITVTRRDHVLTVPVDAVKLGAKGATVTVMRNGRDGKPTFEVVNVQAGISDGERTEILSGLQEGDTVVLAGQVPGMTDQSQAGPRFRGPFPFGGGGGGRGRGR